MQASEMNPSAPATPAAISVSETARRLGVCPKLVYDAIREGSLPSLKLGTRVLVPVAALERVLNGELGGSVGEATPRAPGGSVREATR